MVNQPQRRYLPKYICYATGWILLFLIWRFLLPVESLANALLVGTIPVFIAPFIAGLKSCWLLPRRVQSGEIPFAKKLGEPLVTSTELLQGIAISLAFLIWVFCLIFLSVSDLAPTGIYLVSIVGLLFAYIAVYLLRTLWFGWKYRSLRTKFGYVDRKLRPVGYWVSMGFITIVSGMLIAFAAVAATPLLSVSRL